MEARPDEPTVAQIVRALEQRVDDLEAQYKTYPELGLWGRLSEAKDQLDNIRILAQPVMTGAPNE